MTGDGPEGGPRRTRWLPAAVFSLFALVALADAVVIEKRDAPGFFESFVEARVDSGMIESAII